MDCVADYFEYALDFLSENYVFPDVMDLHNAAYGLANRILEYNYDAEPWDRISKAQFSEDILVRLDLNVRDLPSIGEDYSDAIASIQVDV